MLPRRTPRLRHRPAPLEVGHQIARVGPGLGPAPVLGRETELQVVVVGHGQERRAPPPLRSGQPERLARARWATARAGRRRGARRAPRTTGARRVHGAGGARRCGDATAAPAPYGPSGTVGRHVLEVFVVQPATAPSRDSSFGRLFSALVDNIEHVIQGKREQIHLALVCLMAEGHLLIEDVPGVGKTSLAKAIAASIGGTCHRIQFTPDLLPSDVTGVSVWNRGSDDFEFRPGGVFANVVLADEINRAVPEDAVGAARGDGGAPGHRRRAHVPAPAPVHGHRHAEPDRARRHLPAARGAARPVPDADPDGLPEPGGRARDPAAAGRTHAHRRRAPPGGERGRGRRRQHARRRRAHRARAAHLRPRPRRRARAGTPT